MLHPPSKFEYNAIDTFVLELIVNEVTGQTLNEVFGHKAWRDTGRFAMLFAPSWKKIGKEKVIPGARLKTIRHGGRPEIYLGGFVGKEMQHSFPDIKGLTNCYQWDIVFPDGDIYQGAVGGQGIYILPSADTGVVWFSTGKQAEEISARAIAKSIGATKKGGKDKR